MKPICVKCGLFYRMKKQGVYFEEGMPGPGAARREVDLGTMHCGVCGEGQPCYGHPMLERLAFGDVDKLNRVKPGNLEGWTSYKLWVGDLWECRGCGHQLLSGFGQGPISEHYKPDYQEQRARLGVTLRIDDC